MCKCGKSIFLQSSDGQYCTDIKENKIRLVYYSIEEESEYIEEEKEINYCPICGEKLED